MRARRSSRASRMICRAAPLLGLLLVLGGLSATRAGADSPRDADREGGPDAKEKPYEVISLDEGEVYTVSLEDGDVLENKLIDCRKPRTDFKIRLNGACTVRNIGVLGHPDRQASSIDGAGHFSVKVEGWDNTARVENVYIKGPGSRLFAFVHPYHEGTVVFRNVTVDTMRQPFYTCNSGNNSPTKSIKGRFGRVIIDSCYVTNFYHTAYRLGTGASRVINSVAVTDRGEDGPCRGVWVYYGSPLIENTQISTPGSGIVVAGRSHLNQRWAKARLGENVRIDSPTPIQDKRENGLGEAYRGEYGTDPDLTPPEGCPMSPEEAASGR